LMILYAFGVAEWLGFYAASGLVFFALYALYDPRSHSLRAWAGRLSITVGFMVVLYCVFALGLRVQTPRGLLL